MIISTTDFDDLFIFEPTVIGDERGYFMESYNYKTLLERGIDYRFVQDNQSRSKRGVLRGLHYQNAPYAQAKLVRVLSGSILDIVVDMRYEKSTFKKSFILEMSGENKKQLLVPKGFAHGFLVVSDYAEVLYKADEYYNPRSEGGINFADPSLGLQYLIRDNDVTLSEKDKNLPFFDQTKHRF
jgi:dTDP-4-dehydrorhamnose 3,5-epimerase